ncbi:MAG: hypothetical protein CMM55_02750 [Rhodospirillaceae bacterium]|nr:hypothetical protein [Rhodospirillaceae bacterium]|tara:strand:+ start:95 stop:607 length:513 start_codon:yes stop_codon:yes gene_type:complete
MTEDLMRYDLMVEQALRTVVLEAMGRIAQDGLPGEHHLYITFRTSVDGVMLPDRLLERYPEEMTIVLQHQFDNLTVDDLGFAVSLNFNNVQERLRIPFAAISAFADPSVNFSLQFNFEDREETSHSQLISSETGFQAASGDSEDSNQDITKPTEPEADGNVVTLDTFRKK